MKTEQEIKEELDLDFEKYPLPICFDPSEEQRELYRRDQKLDHEAHLLYEQQFNEAQP